MGPQNLIVAPPRARYLYDSATIAHNVTALPQFDALYNAVIPYVPNITQEQARNLVRLIVKTLLAKKGEKWDTKDLKKVLKQCGMTMVQAKCLIIERLRNVQTQHAGVPDFNLNDNRFFRVEPNGRLDATHLSHVMVTPDGVTEILSGGGDAVSMAIRGFVRQLFGLVHQEVDRVLRFDAEHRSEERARVASARILKTTLQLVDPNVDSEASAQGVLRQFGKKKYDALQIYDGQTPGFESASNALRSVASQEQLARRTQHAVSDHLTTEAKDADRYMNSAAAADLLAQRDRIAAAPTNAGKKRIRNQTLAARPERLKRFNMFAANPNDIGNQNAVVDVQEQAARYLDQSEELDNYH